MPGNSLLAVCLFWLSSFPLALRYVVLLQSVSDVVLNFVFVFGVDFLGIPPLGVEGAAWSTAPRSALGPSQSSPDQPIPRVYTREEVPSASFWGKPPKERLRQVGVSF